ncbi:MAG TPA: hypothetical protein VKG62_04615 [Solirubrobacteraceae bacterium]|nr:hypothetical protein [Solirubrobacteraceae bacterium]
MARASWQRLANRTSAGVVVLAVACTALVSLPGWSPAASATGMSASEPGTEAVEWAVTAVGPRERSLIVVYEYGGCEGPALETTVHETPTTVSIRVQKKEEPPEQPGVVCPAIARIGQWNVPLSLPLGGRAISGVPSPSRVPVPPDVGYAPRFIGFSPQDARNALSLWGLHGQIRAAGTARGLRRVVAQHPAPGSPLSRNETIQLRVAGH